MATALRTFRVQPNLPEPLAPLARLANNLRWSWDHDTREFFDSVDAEGMAEAGGNPVLMVNNLTTERINKLMANNYIMGRLQELDNVLTRHMTENRWAQNQSTPVPGVAYYSAEFGITEVMQVYSGGLGILAGDHLKAASELGLPLVGIGLFYRHGYFNQYLDATNWQREEYPNVNPHDMPIERLMDKDGEVATVTVEVGERQVVVQIWIAMVGRVPLLLLDTDIEGNHEADRVITDRLYGGNSEHRIRQEIILGIGGTRALELAIKLGTVSFVPTVFHANEGHAGFLQFERIRQLVSGERSVLVPGGVEGSTEKLDFESALEVARTGVLFTTHTPVPAGIDRFDHGLIRHWFANYARDFGVSMDRILDIGREPDDPNNGKYNMALMGLRLSSAANGVSKLHGEVSRSMFQHIWPGLEVDDVPITSITNGVHASTWTNKQMSDLFNDHLREDWEWNPAAWENAANIPDDQLWRARNVSRNALIDHSREWLRAQYIRRGASEPTLHWIDGVLDRDALTIGFARRFATYKRATLLLSYPERLKKLLLNQDRPVQFIFAGKSHPADDGGKDLIRQIVNFAENNPEIRSRLVFIEDYDMEVARSLISGVDVWLNNPRRPHEASGTSGEKAVLNGGLHASVLDGWWDEMYISAEDSTFEAHSSNGVENGFAIGTRVMQDSEAQQDAADAASLFDLLEQRLVPLFYDRTDSPFPRRWLKRIRHSLATNGPRVLATRMVMDYVNELYTPLGQHAAELNANAGKRAVELHNWKTKVNAEWKNVSIKNVNLSELDALIGEERTITVEMNLGALSADDVAVEALYGPTNVDGQLDNITVVPLVANGTTYSGKIVPNRAGEFGVSVRAIPANEDLKHWAHGGHVHSI